MRYEIDKNNYITAVYFNCNSGSCTEYTGNIPDGYTSLEEWASNAHIQAYKIVEGNLVYDSVRDAELQEQWELEEADNTTFPIPKLTKLVIGEDIQISDSTESYAKIKVNGKSTQNGTPTPEAPVEIQSIGDDVNLLDYTTVENTSNTVITLIEKGFNVKGKYAGKVVISNLQKNTDYYLQYITENIIGTQKNVVVFAGTSQTTKLKEFTNGIGGTFNTGENTEINIWFYASKGSSENEVNFTKIKLQKGTVATAYSEYGKGTVTIKQTNEDNTLINNYVIPTTPLRSLPNGVKDTIEEDGIHRRVGSVVLDGSGNLFQSNELSNSFRYHTSKILSSKSDNVSISNYFINDTMTNINKIDKPALTVIYGGQIAFRMPKSIGTTVEEIKTWLSENNVIALYELAEEVIEPFDEEQQIAYNNLQRIRMTKGTTYIQSNSGAILEVVYYKNNELNNTFVKKEELPTEYSYYIVTTENTSIIPITYRKYSSGDIVDVYINGFRLIKGLHFSISNNNIVLKNEINVAGTEIEIVIKKI